MSAPKQNMTNNKASSWAVPVGVGGSADEGTEVEVEAVFERNGGDSGAGVSVEEALRVAGT